MTRQLWAAVRVAGSADLAAAALAAMVIFVLVPTQPVRVPGQPDVRTVIWPLIPVFAALGVPGVTAMRWREWTWVASRPRWQPRALVVAMVGVRTAVVIAAAPLDRTVIARNLALFDGLAVGASVLGGGPVWWPLLVVPVVCWFVGVDPPDVIAPWALPLRPPGDRTAAVLAVAVSASGWTAFLVGPVRGGARGRASRWQRP